MVPNRIKPIVASVMLASLSIPVTSSAQVSRYAAYDQPSVVVECGPGQRAILEQRNVGEGVQLVARCVGAARTVAARQTVTRSAPRRTKTKTALMIAGSTATGAGVGGALKGKKGALIGAAVGGGSATIYEAIKRR
jgi:hypothetical protein